ncbi:isoprenylcysteine carboxylmethyltransferase family protein [Hydrogenophaga sp.]|uniref:methyltransferase family protein n=1 Tax=Hydrogenophaga sp. TaxID=1904254 RepID=UPI0025BC9B73|nr:isoprenylcysteine carboxylmethyltransferase family protein [Hydrogenophaga sp.]
MNTHALDTRIPPPVVALIVALLMWNASAWWPLLDLPAWRIPLALGLVAVGAAFDLSGLWAFHRARTTVNPMKPGKTSSLVSSGVYRISRNPMYVGLALFLCAGAVMLWSPLALLGPPVFVAYISRFQIAPEERVLRERFGEVYVDYCARVRRWL